MDQGATRSALAVPNQPHLKARWTPRRQCSSTPQRLPAVSHTCLAEYSPPFQSTPLQQHRQQDVAPATGRGTGNRAWHWARPAGTRAARGSAPGLGMWRARPLAELSSAGRPAAEPTPRPSLGAPIGRSYFTSALPAPNPPGWKRDSGVGGRSGKAGERSSWLGGREAANQDEMWRRGAASASHIPQAGLGG